MRHGVTLLELLVVITVMAVAAGVTALGWRAARAAPAAAVIAALDDAREQAVRGGKAVRWVGVSSTVWFWPDGSASPVRLHVDGVVVVVEALTGAVRAER